MLNNRLSLLLVLVVCLFSGSAASAELFTPLVDILTAPEKLEGKFVTVSGAYYGWYKAPGYPPITRSDWVIADEYDNSIYCTGKLPQTFDPRAAHSIGKPITLLAVVKIKDHQPYLEVQEIKTINIQVEEMVSVAQIVFDPVRNQGRYVGLLGVLAKGHGIKGERLYLLADPTGAIKLGRMPKLYPKGTIMHLRGHVKADENGLPYIDNIEIISAKVD